MVSRLGGQAPALQPVDLLAELGQSSTPSRPGAASSCLRFSLGLGQAAQGGVVLLRRRVVQLGVQRRPLLVELAAALLGGGDGHAVLGQRVERSAGIRPCAGRPAAAGRRSARPAWPAAVCGRVDGGFQLVELRLQGPQLAPPRDQAGGGAARPDDQRAVGLQQLAGKGDEASARGRPSGPAPGRGRASRRTTCGPAAARPVGRNAARSRRTGRPGRARRAGLRDR